MFHLSLPSTFGVHFWSLLYIIPFLPQKITLKQFKKTVLKFYEVFYAFYCGRDWWLMAMMTVYMTMVKEKTDLFGLLVWSPVTCDHTPDTLPPCTYKKTPECRLGHLVTKSLLKKAKRIHVALSKVKMDCRCRKLSPSFCQFLSAVSESEKDCRHIFEQCRLSPKPLGRPQSCYTYFCHKWKN